jgi:phosphoglycolate phosphatase
VVLFDLDGVLVDSRAAIHHSVQAAVDELGLGWTLDYTTDVLPIIGPPMAQSLGELLVRHGGDAARAPDLLAAYRRRYAAVMVSDSSLYDGIADALDALQGSWRLLVATSKPARFAQPLLEGLGVGDAFEAVFGPGADGDLESKGGTIARALQYAGGGSAVMIGDTAFDAVGAAENGIPCIGALWGFGTAEELSAAGAAPLISRPGEIAGAVEAAIARGGLGGLGGLGG